MSMKFQGSTILSILLVVLCFLLTVKAQQSIKILLKPEQNTQSKISRSIFDDGMKSFENEKSGRTPNDLLFRVKRSENDSDKFYVWVDLNNNGRLTDEKRIILADDEKVIVETKKSKSSITVPFELSLNQTKKGTYFFWKAHIQVKGEIKVKNCSAQIYLQDLNANGIFEQHEDGTNLQIDRNNDGQIWGKDEWFFSQEIIEFCGENFLVSAIAQNGSFLTLERTNSQIAKVGIKSPNFELSLLNGKNLVSNELTGKLVLLDFWASWCVPCVKKLPEVKILENEIALFFINTDESSRTQMAEKIITANNLRENSVMKGLGEADYMWKTFARLNNSLPLYVLIDKEGIIIYAGNGGEELKELKAKIAESQK